MKNGVILLYFKIVKCIQSVKEKTNIIIPIISIAHYIIFSIFDVPQKSRNEK
jgi:hypothetical protein